MLLTRCLIGHFCIDWYYRKVGRIWTPNWTRPSLSFLSMSTPRQKARPESTDSPESLPESPASLESPDSLESPELPKSNGSPILSLGSIGLHPFHPPGDQLAISLSAEDSSQTKINKRLDLETTPSQKPYIEEWLLPIECKYKKYYSHNYWTLLFLCLIWGRF